MAKIEGAGGGIVALEDIQAGEVVWSIPERVLLSPTQAAPPPPFLVVLSLNTEPSP